MISGYFLRDWLILDIVATTLIVVIGICLVLFVVSRNIKRRGVFAQVKQKQMLARMILSNKYYEIKKRQDSGKSREKIIMPKVFYRYGKKKVITEITMPADGGRFHDRFLKMGKTFEEMYVADLIETSREIGYVTYRLLCDVVGNRYSLQQVTTEGTQINLMIGTSWNWDKAPHMLISGGTGGGKTYFLFSLIYKLMQIGIIDVCDPKQADLADLGDIPAFKGHVFTTNDFIARCLKNAVKDMEQRYAYMKSLPNYVSGKNYSYYEMPPHFVIVDEWAAFMSTLNYSESDEILKDVKQLILKARQAGVFLIIATQRADAENFGGGIRDNMMFKVTLGQLAPVGYDMMFGDENKNKAFFNKDIRGRGYKYDSSGVPSEFYAPLVPSDFQFMTEFRKIQPMKPFIMNSAEKKETDD